MKHASIILGAALAVSAAAASPAQAQDNVAAAAPPAKLVAAQKTLMASRQFAAAAASLEKDWDAMIADIVTLTEIEAPPFGEAKRAAVYADKLKAAGLIDVTIDKAGNAYGFRKGTGGGPLLVVAAHLDTVFPAGTDVKVKRDGDRMAAPGIADDTAALATLLSLVRALDAAKIATKSDIVFMGDVGEEGQGDLRGMRHLFNEGPLAGKIGQFISIESGGGRVTTLGVGSRRYRLTYKGPGGHSFGAFGLVNPAYALGDAMTEFGKTKVPSAPKTTYSIGTLSGGTSVNSIPFSVSAEIDMRSESKAELDAVEKHYLSLLQPAADRENTARSTRAGKIEVDNKLIGDRPAGSTPTDAPIVQVAAAAIAAGGVTPRYASGSTDSNLPMSLGIPAITLGSGFDSARNHSLDEYLTLDKPKNLQTMRANLATIITLAGGTAR